MDRDRFVGTWRLVSMEGRSEDGSVSYPFGADAQGMITYDNQGYMQVQIMRRDRPRFAGNDQGRGTAEENQAALQGYLAYFGTYELREDGTVVHHMEGSIFPNWVGGEIRRFWEFSGDRLVLRGPLASFGGQTRSVVIVWERIA